MTSQAVSEINGSLNLLKIFVFEKIINFPDIPPSTPDSGTHSTESDMIEEPNSDEVAAMLSIMKT